MGFMLGIGFFGEGGVGISVGCSFSIRGRSGGFWGSGRSGLGRV